MKIKLSENEIDLLVCVLEASLDSPCRYAKSYAGELSAMETQRKKAELIGRMKKMKNKI
ncbi:MAG: hypothetical protein U9R21_06985 [Candidatus Thermoplasmatota archaeon]|nr:hypothetical protein [Candidatus Thermoplasmatota archaeon]